MENININIVSNTAISAILRLNLFSVTYAKSSCLRISLLQRDVSHWWKSRFSSAELYTDSELNSKVLLLLLVCWYGMLVSKCP